MVKSWNLDFRLIWDPVIQQNPVMEIPGLKILDPARASLAQMKMQTNIYMNECLSLTPKNLGQIMINQGHAATAVVEQNGYLMIRQNCEHLYQAAL